MTDIIYLHSMIFTTQSFHDMKSGGRPGPLALFHFCKTLGLLQQRIATNDDILAVSDATMMVVMTLATAASVIGDHEAAMTHMNGLCRIVELRGGLEALRNNEGMLQSKICR